jgi:membrane protease YdiL (CAAX protease family)
LAFVIATIGMPAGAPRLGLLLAGFVLMVTGLAALTMRRSAAPLHSAHATRRAAYYAVVYGLSAACFMRVIGGALLGHDRSPWLLALGDVVFVTLGLFVWVMVLAEDRPLSDFGFRGAPAARMLLTALMGLGAVVLYSFEPYRALADGRLATTTDGLLFAALFAAAGSALPEEVLFRGYFMGSLEKRYPRWARVALPALAFTVVRSLRYAPASGLAVQDWVFYVLGVALPLGLWWGLMRDLSGSLWPGLLSHFLLEFGPALANTSPTSPSTPP